MAIAVSNTVQVPLTSSLNPRVEEKNRRRVIPGRVAEGVIRKAMC
jgi:hypothetical protein